MKKGNLTNLTDEELLKKQESTKMYAGIFTGIVFVYVTVTVAECYREGVNWISFILPACFVLSLYLLKLELNKIQEEISVRKA